MNQLNTEIKKNSSLYILLLLSALSAFGPFVTDLYLPSLPFLNAVFHTTTPMVQLSLTVSFLGLAVGQLLFGPISDKYGRKLPLISSLLLFLFSSLGCIFSWRIEVLILFRLLQGFAGAGGIVIAKSIAVDLYEDKALTKFLSLLAAIQGLAPILAPLAGGMLLKFTNWKGIFETLLGIGLAIFAASVFLKESLPVKRRLQVSVLHTFKYFVPIFRNRSFMKLTWALSLAMGAFFGYISASPFIFQELYGVTPQTFSIFFAINAVGFIIGSQAVRAFHDISKALLFGAVALAVVTLGIFVVLHFHLPLWLIELLFFCMTVCIGGIVPVATAKALDQERELAGNASAILGFLQFLVGSIASPLVGIGNVAIATGIVLTISALGCLFFVKKAINGK